MSIVLDHLWQSTAVLAVIGLLTLFFRNNGAHVRHALWTVASLKFLVPFFVLNGLGIWLAHLLGLAVPSLAAVETLHAAGQPFSDGPIFRAMPMPGAFAVFVLMAVWLAGVCALLAVWVSRWWTLRGTVRAARDGGIAAPMPVAIAPAQLEPGLVGIFRSVLLLPEGIAERLTAEELQAVIAHEACHKRRRDNLWAALHMLAEAIFWFWPPVWWLGARLVAERERACDEAVLAAGNDPETYAGSILKVCQHYVQLPLACAAGVAGANLNHRMETIMENRMLVRLNGMKKGLLAAAATVLVAVPLAAGLLWSPVAAAPACEPVAVMATHTLPPYPVESQKAGETGTVLLRVTIAKDGRPSRAAVSKSSGFWRLDLAASEFVQQRYRWQPLACGSVQAPLKVVFSLADVPAARKGAKPPAHR
jgi:TonB family protein